MARANRRQFLRLAGAACCGWALPAVSGAAPAWVDGRQHGPFEIRAAFDLTPYTEMLNSLSRLELELRRVLALRPCTQPIAVELLANKHDHRQYLAERFPAVPYRRALFVKQEGHSTVFAYQDDELPVDLRHECTHALLHADLPMMPLWLDEGLAEYFEPPQAERAFNHPHAKALAWDLRFGLVEDLKKLESKRDLSDMNIGDYRSAWAWTHFMLHGPRAASEQLWGFLGDIRRGQPPGLLSDRLEAALPGVEGMLARHFQQWRRIASQRRQRA